MAIEGLNGVAIGVRKRAAFGYHSFWESVLGLTRYGGRLIPSVGYGAVQAAVDIFTRFLDGGTESHLLMLDDDAVLAPETITRLLSRNLPVVGGLTWTGGLPPMPTIWRGYSSTVNGSPSWLVRYDDVAKLMAIPEVGAELQAHQMDAGLVMKWDGPEALSRNDVIGFHCVLIRREVLEALRATGEPFCVGNALGVREDFDFSEKVIKAGFDLFVDKSVIVGHTIAHGIRPLDYYIYAMAREQDMKAQP